MDLPPEHAVAKVLRAQAWARAKGELNAVIATLNPELVQHEELSDVVTQFITHIEEEKLHE